MVDVPREKRLERAKTRGWTEAEFARREAAQWPADEKRRLAAAVIPNAGTEAELRAAVRDFWRQNIAPSFGRRLTAARLPASDRHVTFFAEHARLPNFRLPNARIRMT